MWVLVKDVKRGEVEARLTRGFDLYGCVFKVVCYVCVFDFVGCEGVVVFILL